VLVSTSFVVALGYGMVAPALPIFARSFDVGVGADMLQVLATVTADPPDGRGLDTWVGRTPGWWVLSVR
jgi:hypothetical protein